MMVVPKKQLLAGLLVVATMALSVAGCSSQQAEPRVGSGAGADADRYGGTMVMAIGDPVQPNFIFYRSTTEGRLRDLVYDRLFVLDNDGKIVPRLATHFEAQNDNKTYVVHLRKGVKWQDGEDFTADDVVFYFEFYEKVESSTKSNVYPFTVTKIDDHTVRFDLEQPMFSFISDNRYTEYVALPEHIWKDVDPGTFDKITDLKYFTGTGPFRITEMKAGDSITLVRNEHYWDGRPYLDGVVMRVLTDADALEVAFENGEVNLHRVSQQTIDRLQGAPGFRFGSWPSGNMNLFLLNHKDPILAQLSVRKALSYLMNREAMMAAKQVKADVMKSCFTPADTFYNPDACDPEIAVYSVEKAIAVLDEDGWELNASGVREKDGVELRLAITASGASDPAFQIIIADCKKAGIEMSIDVVDKVTRNARVFGAEPDFQLFWNGMTLGPAAVGYMQQYSSGSAYLRYESPEVRGLFHAAEASKTVEEAQKHYDEIQRILTEDRAAIWLWSAMRNWGSNKNLNTDDCGMNGLYCGWNSISKAYFEKK